MMERLLYCILKSVAILPLQVLYVLADCVFFLLYYITKFTHSYLSSNLHIVPCFESELYVILGVAGGMVEKHHLKFLIKALTELIYPFQPTDKPHINFPLSLSE